MSSVADEIVATAQVKDGRLYIKNRRTFDQQVAQMSERWTLEVAVRRLRATRSVQANRYYWGVCIALASEHTGYTPDEMHEVAKQMFIPKRLAVCDGNGEVKGEFVMGGSTRNLNTVEFWEYVDSFRRWCAEQLDVVIPDPDPEWRR